MHSRPAGALHSQFRHRRRDLACSGGDPHATLLGELLSDPAAAGRILQARLAHVEREVFTVLFLDTRHCLLAVEDLFQGTIDGCEVHCREIAKRALQLNASAVILGHQHPWGNPEPSAADRAATARVKQSLALLDIRLLDHFVVGGASTPVSLASRGWI